MIAPQSKPWAVHGDAETRDNLITSIYMTPETLEEHVNHLEEKYANESRGTAMFEKYKTADAEVIVIGYGIVSRILKTAVDRARAQGIKAGLFSPRRSGRSLQGNRIRGGVGQEFPDGRTEQRPDGRRRPVWRSTDGGPSTFIRESAAWFRRLMNSWNRLS